ncbi:hypothetical protein ABZS88_39845 [Streptomyces sp. NPDC005480]|uniref:hypothetical protein n=1 Tax=Streptomyces sp. NPDC005480 TaxID=3154880 RepID=UPI0033A3BA98
MGRHPVGGPQQPGDGAALMKPRRCAIAAIVARRCSVARQIAPAILRATPLDLSADSGVFAFEQFVQIAQRYAVVSGDGLRGQVGSAR